MRNAEIAQEGSPRDLYEAPADNFVADFIGDANLVEAEIAALQDGQALVRIGAVERRLPARGLGPGAVKVAIRPEAIRIARNGRGGILEADGVKATYLGRHMEYTLNTPQSDKRRAVQDWDRTSQSQW